MDWYPFYPALYRAHTMHLTAEQDGIYRRLIDYYMESRQPLPDSDFALARIAGVDAVCFKDASSILRAFFKQEEGVLKHSKCDELLDEQDNKSKFYAKRAKKAASIRHGKTKDLCLKQATSNSQAMLGDATITVNNNNNSKKEVKDNTIVLSKKPKVSLDELSVDHISDWLAEKRGQGLYIDHDPHLVLEKFKDYCKSKGKKYADYKAAYRGAFDWDKCQPTKAGKPTWRSEGERLAAKYTAEAEQAEAEFNAGKSLCAPKAIR